MKNQNTQMKEEEICPSMNKKMRTTAVHIEESVQGVPNKSESRKEKKEEKNKKEKQRKHLKYICLFI